jgi:hypothetical protein
MWKSRSLDPVSDASIRRSAAGMIRNHGNGAARQCEAVINKMALHKDSSGERVWRRIRQAVLETQSSREPVTGRASGAPLCSQPGILET